MVKNNKKAYTLVELIICIFLISIVGVSIFIGINKNNKKDKEREKTISQVINAADVYYSMNQSLNSELKNNYGYLVLNVNDLKNNGILDDNMKVPELTKSEEEENLGKTYDKLVINDDDVELGKVNIIYPYEKGIPLMMNLNEISIEDFEKDLFQCNSNLDKIDYMNEDYAVSSIDNFYCGVYDYDDTSKKDNTTYKQKEEILDGIEGGNSYTLGYKINVNGKDIVGTRLLRVNTDYNPTFSKKFSDGSDYVCGEYTNQDVTLSFEEDTSQDRNIKFSWYKDGTEIEDNKEDDDKSFYIVKETGNYKGEYLLKGRISDNSKIGNSECKINIDKIKPVINVSITDNILKASISDDDSGVYGYIYSKEPKTISELEFKDFTKEVEFSFNVSGSNSLYYIYAIDNAGNIKELEYNVGDGNYPSITYEPIDNSFSKFKVTVKNISGKKEFNIENIKVQFDFNNEELYNRNNYKDNEQKSGSIDKFIENYKYDKSYDSKKSNYIDYNKYNEGYTCNESECSFVIDMINEWKTCSVEGECSVFFDYKDLFNLNLNYHVYAKNNQGFYKEVKINSVLNMYIDFTSLSGLFNYGKYSVYFEKDNNYGDLIFRRYNSEGKNNRLFYYNNSKNKNNDLGEFSYNYGITYDKFDEDGVNFTICRNYKQEHVRKKWNSKKMKYEKIYYYVPYKDYKRFKFNNDTEKLEIDEEYDKEDNSKCNFTSKVSNNYKGEVYYDKFENSREFFSRYLDLLKDWEKKNDHTTNPDYYNISNIVSNYVFYQNINGVTWNSIIILTSSGAVGNRNKEYDKLFFLPEVTLNNIKSVSGKID